MVKNGCNLQLLSITFFKITFQISNEIQLPLEDYHRFLKCC